MAHMCLTSMQEWRGFKCSEIDTPGVFSFWDVMVQALLLIELPRWELACLQIIG